LFFEKRNLAHKVREGNPFLYVAQNDKTHFIIQKKAKKTTTPRLRTGREYKGKTDLQRIRGVPLVALFLARSFGSSKRMNIKIKV